MTSIGDSPLRRARLAQGLGQSALAREAGLSRQALSAIEAGAYQPGVAVALRLARALGQSVEKLFAPAAGSERVAVSWLGPPRQGDPGWPPARVALARVGGRLVAVPTAAARLGLTLAAGVVERLGGRRAEVAAFRSPAEIDATLLMAGCDPAVSIFGDFLHRGFPPVEVAPLPCASRAALEALAQGKAHVAGIHLRDAKSGEYNLGPARVVLGSRRLLVVNFARWELGLASRCGGRRALGSVADLARRGLRLVNREPGSGARAALDEALAEHRLEPTRIAGYSNIAAGHLEVAAAIAEGLADAGVTIRVAAEAYGLNFVVLREERYDLIVPRRGLNSMPVSTMLEALNSSRLAHEIASLCAYDTGAMGQVVARLN